MREKNYFFIQSSIILRENIVQRCFSNCYSALHVKKATVANLKKKFGDGKTVGGGFCVCLLSIFGFKEPIGDVLRASPTGELNTKSSLLERVNPQNRSPMDSLYPDFFLAQEQQLIKSDEVLFILQIFFFSIIIIRY